MPDRDLYLAAYDISNGQRLTKALRAVRTYATGGQKSVHEIYLTAAEKIDLLRRIAGILDHAADRFFLLRLDPRAKCQTLGVGAPPSDTTYFYVG